MADIYQDMKKNRQAYNVALAQIRAAKDQFNADIERAQSHRRHKNSPESETINAFYYLQLKQAIDRICQNLPIAHNALKLPDMFEIEKLAREALNIPLDKRDLEVDEKERLNQKVQIVLKSKGYRHDTPSRQQQINEFYNVSSGIEQVFKTIKPSKRSRIKKALHLRSTSHSISSESNRHAFKILLDKIRHRAEPSKANKALSTDLEINEALRKCVVDQDFDTLLKIEQDTGAVTNNPFVAETIVSQLGVDNPLKAEPVIFSTFDRIFSHYRKLVTIKSIGLPLGVVASDRNGYSSEGNWNEPVWELNHQIIHNYVKDKPNDEAIRKIAESIGAVKDICQFKQNKYNKDAPKNLAQRVKKGELTTLPSSSKGHYTGVTIVPDGQGGAYLAYTNKGGGYVTEAKRRLEGSGTKIFKVNDINSINPKFIETLMQGLDKGMSHEVMLSTILSVVEQPMLLYLEQKPQKMGNCSIANTRANIHGALVCLKSLELGKRPDELTQVELEGCKQHYKDYTSHIQQGKINELIHGLKNSPEAMEYKELARNYFLQHEDRRHAELMDALIGTRNFDQIANREHLADKFAKYAPLVPDEQQQHFNKLYLSLKSNTCTPQLFDRLIHTDSIHPRVVKQMEEDGFFKALNKLYERPGRALETRLQDAKTLEHLANTLESHQQSPISYQNGRLVNVEQMVETIRWLNNPLVMNHCSMVLIENIKAQLPDVANIREHFGRIAQDAHNQVYQQNQEKKSQPPTKVSPATPMVFNSPLAPESPLLEAAQGLRPEPPIPDTSIESMVSDQSLSRDMYQIRLKVEQLKTIQPSDGPSSESFEDSMKRGFLEILERTLKEIETQLDSEGLSDMALAHFVSKIENLKEVAPESFKPLLQDVSNVLIKTNDRTKEVMEVDDSTKITKSNKPR